MLGTGSTYKWINLSVTPRVMSLDMLKLRRTAKSLYIPIQFPQPFMQMRVAGADIADIALEVLHVHSIKADYRCVQAYVCFGDRVTKVIG